MSLADKEVHADVGVSTATGSLEAAKTAYTKEEERALVRKSTSLTRCLHRVSPKPQCPTVDLHVLPGLTALYLLSFLDRSNSQ
jgi:hypothetical protein